MPEGTAPTATTLERLDLLLWMPFPRRRLILEAMYKMLGTFGLDSVILGFATEPAFDRVYPVLYAGESDRPPDVEELREAWSRPRGPRLGTPTTGGCMVVSRHRSSVWGLWWRSGEPRHESRLRPWLGHCRGLVIPMIEDWPGIDLPPDATDVDRVLVAAAEYVRNGCVDGASDRMLHYGSWLGAAGDHRRSRIAYSVAYEAAVIDRRPSYAAASGRCRAEALRRTGERSDAELWFAHAVAIEAIIGANQGGGAAA